jgi:hypothetical protein
MSSQNRVRTDEPRTHATLRTVKLLVGGYVALSVLTLVAVFLLRDNPAVVTPPVWIRTGIVAATSLLIARFAAGAAAGAPRMFLRLRLVSAILLVAVLVIVALPGAFPVWLRLEQAVCGVLLAGVVVLVNGRTLRTAFAGRERVGVS